MAEHTDALLDELNGALAKAGDPMPVPGDPPEIPAPTLAEQLEVGANAPKQRPAPLSPNGSLHKTPEAARVDKTHSKAAGGFGYAITVEGEYYSASKETKGHIIKKYSLKFNLPSLTNGKGEAALGIIVGASKPGGGMLALALKKMDPLAKTYRTHVITKVEPLNGAPEPTSLQYMSFESLAGYVRDSGIPIDPEEYWDVEHLREDVIYYKTNYADNKDARTGEHLSDAIQDGKGLGVKKSALEQIHERHAERKEQRDLLAMNPGLGVGA